MPIPNATTRARVESGRAMSGRTGISLASTVSSVIDVPATQSSGVNVIWPAWTEAISSSVDAKTLPPLASMVATFGWTSDVGQERHGGHRQGDDHADGGDDPRHRPLVHAPGRCPTPRIDQGEQDHDQRRAEDGDEEERDQHAGGDRPDRVDREQASPTRCRRGARRRRAGPTPPGKLMPSTIVTGSTTRMVDASSARRVASGLPGSRFSGRTSTPTSPTITSTATTIWATARNRTGSPMRGRTRLNTSAPEGEADQEDAQDHREDVRRVAVPDASSRVHSTW